MYDIIIISAAKDFNKIKYLYKSILQYIQPTPNKIYCICPEYPSDMISGITYKLDKDVLNIDISNIKYKPTWIYQQYIKLLQNITLNDYLVIDSDIIINKSIEIFSDNKPNFFISNNNYSKTFFDYSKTLFNIDKKYNSSFISEIMLFDMTLVNEMLLTKFKDHDDFINESNKIITNTCYLSEYELYGNYIYDKHTNEYNYKKIKSSPFVILNNLTDSGIEEYLSKMKDYNFDIIKISSIK